MRRRLGSGSSGTFDKFTKRARKVLSLAQEEAQRLGHNYLGPEHLLLGLVIEGNGAAVIVLDNLGVDRERVREAIIHIVGHTDREVRGEIGLAPRSKKVLELAVDEGRRMGHHYIGTEHLLLGMLREGESIAADVLARFGLKLGAARAETLRVLNQRATTPEDAEEPDEAEVPEPPSLQSGAGPKNNVVTCRLDDRSVSALDALVEAGVRATRSDAAAWLIAAGIDAHQALFDRLATTIQTIRQLRQEAQMIAREVTSSLPAGADSGAPTRADKPPRAARDDSADQAGERDEHDEGGADTRPLSPLD